MISPLCCNCMIMLVWSQYVHVCVFECVCMCAQCVLSWRRNLLGWRSKYSSPWVWNSCRSVMVCANGVRGNRLWKPNAIWLEVNRKAIFFLPQCAERKKKELFAFFFLVWVKVNETDWWPSLQHGVHLPNNNISAIIGISGEAGQGKILKNAQTTKTKKIYLQ